MLSNDGSISEFSLIFVVSAAFQEVSLVIFSTIFPLFTLQVSLGWNVGKWFFDGLSKLKSKIFKEISYFLEDIGPYILWSSLSIFQKFPICNRKVFAEYFYFCSNKRTCWMKFCCDIHWNHQKNEGYSSIAGPAFNCQGKFRQTILRLNAILSSAPEKRPHLKPIH